MADVNSLWAARAPVPEGDVAGVAPQRVRDGLQGVLDAAAAGLVNATAFERAFVAGALQCLTLAEGLEQKVPFVYVGAVTRALAYVRVSTADQAENGASLAAQEHALREEAERRRWVLEVVREEGWSAKTLRRPALQAALRSLDRGEAQVLMAVRLDRLSRSVSDFAGLLDRAARRGWGICMLSPNIDTSDAAGRFTANVLASAAQYERELISLRTKEGMAQKKAEGVRLGRQVAPQMLPVYRRVIAMRAAGTSLNGIAASLNDDRVPTARGGLRWHASTVKRILESETAKSL